MEYELTESAVSGGVALTVEKSRQLFCKLVGIYKLFIVTLKSKQIGGFITHLTHTTDYGEQSHRT